jgi:hypothetical protein
MIKPYSVFLAFTLLWLVSMSCRPIIAIGWTEIIIIVVLVAILMGPLLFRLYRFIDRVRRANQEKENK